MPTLLEVQQAFRDALLTREGEAVEAATGLIAPDGLDASARLQIHRNHVFLTLGDALAGLYPAVHAMVGEGFFRAAARRFIAAQPPRQPSLYAFGGELAAFLEGFEPASGLPYLPDLARLEWAMHESFHARDEPALNAADLARLPAEALEGLVLRLRADARLVRSAWPVARLWQAASAGDGEAVAAIDARLAPDHLLVLRDGLDARLWELSAGEWHWLAACAKGQGLGAAAEAGLAADPGFDLAAALTPNLQRGSFAPLSETPA